MVRVPGDPGPQVSLNPLPDVRHQAFASPWSAVANAAGRMNEVVEQVEITRVEDAINKVRASSLQLQDEALSQVGSSVRPTKDGKSFTDVYMQKFSEMADKEGSALSSDRQKALYQKRVGLLGSMFQTGVNEHERKELLAGHLQTNEATREIEAQAATKSLDNKQALMLSRARVDESIQADIDMKKLDGPTAEVYRQTKLTGFHGAVLGAALDSNRVDYAKKYLEAHGEEMSPVARSKADEIIKKQEAEISVMSAVDEVEATGMNFVDKAKTLREKFKDNPDAIRLSVQELGARKTQKEVAKQETEGQLWDMYTGLNGGKRLSIRDIEKTSQWNSLDGTDRKRIAREWEADAKRNAGDSPDNLAKFATFMRLTDDPKQLVGLSDAQICSFAGVLGTDLTKKLLIQKRDAAGNLGKLTRATVDAAQFKDLAREYGLKVSDPGVKMKDEDQTTLGKLRDKTLDAIRVEQMSTGREVTQERKEQIIRNELKRVPTRKPGGPMRPSVLGPEKHAFQIEGAWEIGAADEEKERAYNYLVKSGAPTTPENMWAMIEFLRNNK